MVTRILDLFCGAGGAGYGYALSGLEVTGVDVKRQKHYPFAFVHEDAMYILQNNMPWIKAHFHFIHASPPCQHYSVLHALHNDVEYPDLIDQLRHYLALSGLPYIIENVRGAPLNNPLMLCGTMFGLRLFRHRYFEIGKNGFNICCKPPKHIPHKQLGLRAPEIARQPKEGEVFSIYGHFSGAEGARQAMGIDWMSRDELAQAIPPAYTNYIMNNLLGWA